MKIDKHNIDAVTYTEALSLAKRRTGKPYKPFVFISDGEIIECNKRKLQRLLSETRNGLPVNLYYNLDGQVVVNFDY